MTIHSDKIEDNERHEVKPMDSWDPLGVTDRESTEIMAAAAKTSVRNVLKSYVGYYDAFCEMIQNAMDAVDERERRLKESKYNKRLWIRVHIPNRTFSITDNGIGFSQREFRSFMAPSVTFKSGRVTRGRKGVGATFLAFGFDCLRVGTRTPEFSGMASLMGGRSWVEGDSDAQKPLVNSCEVEAFGFNEIDRGSAFVLELRGPGVRPSNLAWIKAHTAEQWATVLRAKTPLGDFAASGGSKSPVHFDLEVVAPDGAVSTVLDCRAEYLFPHSVIDGCKDFREFTAAQMKLVEAGRNASQVLRKGRNLNGVFGAWTAEQVQEHVVQSPSESTLALLKAHGFASYGFFACSTTVWDTYNDKILGLREGLRILGGGLHLATDDMTQGEPVTIHLTSNIGYQNQAHVVVRISNAEPDLGRKGFQPEILEAAQVVARGVVRILKDWRKQLRKDTGAPLDIKADANRVEWIREQEAHAEKQPLVINNKAFFAPSREIGIFSVPQSEQDVIVLLNQLIAGGVVRGVKMMATSQNRQYDALFRYVMQAPLENLVYEESNNPLGVPSTAADEVFLSPSYVLEYKYSMDALLRDFESGEKRERDIHLVVAWDIGTEWKRRYQVVSYLERSGWERRQQHGITHSILDAASGDERFQAIILSDLIRYLNEREKVEAEQGELYGAEY